VEGCGRERLREREVANGHKRYIYESSGPGGETGQQFRICQFDPTAKRLGVSDSRSSVYAREKPGETDSGL